MYICDVFHIRKNSRQAKTLIRANEASPGRVYFPVARWCLFLKGKHPLLYTQGRANSNLHGVLGGGNSLSWGQSQEFHLARRCWIPLWRQAFGPRPFSSFTARLARENLLTYLFRRLTALLLLPSIYWLFECVKMRLKLVLLSYFIFQYTYTRYIILYP